MELLLQNSERNCLASQNEEREKKANRKKIAVHFLDVEEIQREIKFC